MFVSPAYLHAQRMQDEQFSILQEEKSSAVLVILPIRDTFDLQLPSRILMNSQCARARVQASRMNMAHANANNCCQCGCD